MNVEVKCGQWWAGNDSRTIINGVFQRVGQVVEFREHPTKGTQVLVSWRPPPHPSYGVNRGNTWVSIRRFRPGSSGYRYIGTHAPSQDVGPNNVHLQMPQHQHKPTSDQEAARKLAAACDDLAKTPSGDSRRAEEARETVVKHVVGLLEEFGLLDVARALRKEVSQFDGRHLSDGLRGLWECAGCHEMVEQLSRHDGKLLCQRCIKKG